MNTSDVFSLFGNTFAAKQVYSEPFQVEGTTVITAAVVGGGAGMRREGVTSRKGAAVWAALYDPSEHS